MCGEVAGGNAPVHTSVALPGLRGTLYSRPCQGARGGDVHYLSVCGSGLLSRVCVADVAGHGETVAKVGTVMHAQLRRSVDTPDERRVFRRLDRQLGALGTRAMTTAALVTYYPPSRRLTISYAGHPPGWLYRRSEGCWVRLEPAAHGGPGPFQGLPLGTGFESEYSRRRLALEVGDRIVLVTDGVLEAPRPGTDDLFGSEGVERVLADGSTLPVDRLCATLLDSLRDFAGPGGLDHDDITVFVGEFVPGPPGPALWHLLKNRVFTRHAPARV